MKREKSGKEAGTQAFIVFCLILCAPLIFASMLDKLMFWKRKSPKA